METQTFLLANSKNYLATDYMPKIYKRKYIIHFLQENSKALSHPTGQKLTELNHGQLLSRFLLL